MNITSLLRPLLAGILHSFEADHIAAVSAAGKKFGIKTTGIIRGEESSKSNLCEELPRELDRTRCGKAFLIVWTNSEFFLQDDSTN